MTIQEFKSQNPIVAIYSRHEDDYDSQYRYCALFRNEEGYNGSRQKFISENCYGTTPTTDCEVEFNALPEETQNVIAAAFGGWFYQELESLYISVETFLPRTHEREMEELEQQD